MTYRDAVGSTGIMERVEVGLISGEGGGLPRKLESLEPAPPSEPGG